MKTQLTDLEMAKVLNGLLGSVKVFDHGWLSWANLPQESREFYLAAAKVMLNRFYIVPKHKGWLMTTDNGKEAPIP